MSYDDLLPWRGLAQRIPKDILNPTHRLIIVTLITYESNDKGAFFKPENIASELGLSKRTVYDNFHYLSNGLVWKDGERKPCLNPECKDHLGIIATARYARAGKAQTYRVNMEVIKALASVHLSAPSETSVPLATELHAPEDCKHAPADVSVCTQSHAYKHNKQSINVTNDTNAIDHVRFDKFLLLLPKELQGLMAGANYEASLNALEARRVPLVATAQHLAKQNYSDARNIGGLVNTVLKAFANRPATHATNELPDWCGECKSSDDRRFGYRFDIKNGNGSTTDNCPKCSKWAQQGGEQKYPMGQAF